MMLEKHIELEVGCYKIQKKLNNVKMMLFYERLVKCLEKDVVFGGNWALEKLLGISILPQAFQALILVHIVNFF